MKKNNSLGSFAILLRVLVFSLSVTGEEGTRPADGAIYTPRGFVNYFKTKSLLDGTAIKPGDSGLQVGFLDAKEGGKLFLYRIGSKELIMTSVNPREDRETVEVAVTESLKKEMSILLKCAPNSPMEVNEAGAIAFGGGGKYWLFEYIDPLGGRQSIITMEELDTSVDIGFVIREHDAFSKSFSKIITEIEDVEDDNNR